MLTCSIHAEENGHVSFGALERISESLYRMNDVCNVYLVKRGDRALLIDSGRGEILGRLDEMGVKAVDWVLHTHAHRDQCGATNALVARGARVAVPAREEKLFSDIEGFWDRFDPFIRYAFKPDTYKSRVNIAVDRALADGESLEWEGIVFRSLATPGHTTGSGSWIAELDGRVVAFTGDMIHSPGKLWNLYSFDYRYWDGGFRGISDNLESLDKVLHAGAERFLPSHGVVMDDPAGAVGMLRANLEKLYDFGPPPAAPAPSGSNEPVRRWRRVSEHLYHLRPTSFLLLSSDSTAMFYDHYAVPQPESAFHYDSILPVLDELGVKRVEVAIPSHFHEDHLRGFPDLVRRFGTEVWVYENMADILEHPSRYNLPCLAPERIKADRILHDMETIRWKEYEFTIMHFPGQTEYHQAMYGTVDGRRVLFAGDSDVYAIGDPNIERRNRKLHGISTFLNYYRLEPGEGYLKTIQRVIDFNPELLLYSHSGPKPGNPEMYRLNLESMQARRGLVAEILPHADPNIGFDPNRVNFYPYLTKIRPGETFETAVRVRNHLDDEILLRISLNTPPGWSVEPPLVEMPVEGKKQGEASFRVVPDRRTHGRVRTLITAQVESGGEDWGEPAEMILEWTDR